MGDEGLGDLDEHPFGDVVPGEAVIARPPSDGLDGYQPRRRWVYLPVGGKRVPEDWIAPQGGTMTTAIERPLETPTVTAEQLALIKATVAVGATDAELKLFLFDCARQGVHPLDRLVHFTKRGGKYTPITSIDFMRIRAADTGEMAGSDEPDFNGYVTDTENSPPASATVTVYRMTQGQRFAYTATARWSEYKPEQNDFMWRKMPHTMLGKCAEALALRKGFPRQLAGLYAKEEMDQAGTDTEPPRSPVAPAAPPFTSAPRQPAAATVEIRGTLTREPGEDDLPAGFALIDSLKQDGDFLHVTWGRDLQGGWTVYKTKLPHIAFEAKAAFAARVPVRLSGKKAPYIDKVERLDGGMSKAELAGTKWTPDQLENQSL